MLTVLIYTVEWYFRRQFMDKHQHHEELINGLYEQLKPVLDNSQQAIYVYLDDIHKICNNKFATLLGYSSPEEWAKVTGSFPDVFVDQQSQEVLVSTYQKVMEQIIGSEIEVTWKTKSGDRVNTNLILVPIAYNGHLFALHFISKHG